MKVPLLARACATVLFATSGVLPAFADPPTPTTETAASVSPREAAETALLHILMQTQSGEISWPACDIAVEGAPSADTRSATLLRQMAMAEDPNMRSAAFEGLELLSDEETVAVLLRGLTDEDERVRRAAREGLAKHSPEATAQAVLASVLGEGRAIPGLIEALPSLRVSLEDPLIDILADDAGTPSRQVAAARLLGSLRSAKATDWLAKRAWVRHEALALACTEALVQTAAPNAREALRELLRHPLRSVRMLAMEGIARVGGPDAVQTLYAAAAGAGEPDLNVRRHAAIVLGHVNEPAAMEALLKLLMQDGALRLEVGASLRRLTNQPIEASPIVWGEWYKAWKQNPVWPPPPPPKNTGVEVSAF